ncbi:glycosyltransferase [Altererythrobacter sp. SALINAS58]|uniref:glycosyltransferase n=1 Tax=Alteripontixanthobacter muriae TaxID=2705546 RepID=UPI001575AA96|nr:glycosyltransferase [Alteripontixanthobacter muriae]NTZ44116.1 glycosyltransferase [Alteripontixanthobacter muriae]
MSDPGSRTSIVIPMLDEAVALPRLVRVLGTLHPRPVEIIAVDGGSTDASRDIAQVAGWTVLCAPQGRAIQINAGVEAARGPYVCVLHADTIPPDDFVAVIESSLADRSVALAGFTPIIAGPDRTRWGTTFHNWLKTWYAPLLVRPHLFLRGVRLLFGDHAMFFRREDYLAVGGCDPGTPVMEEADLCIKMAERGRVRLVGRAVHTSDRRIAAWGPVKANWIYFKIGILWAFGARSRLADHYPDIR